MISKFFMLLIQLVVARWYSVV